MSDQPSPGATADASALVEALSREDGKNSTVRVYRDRIEWLKEQSISSLPRPKSEPPVIPLRDVRSVKARKDGPLFSKVLVRTGDQTIVFRMYSPQAVQVRDVIAALLAGEDVAPVARADSAASAAFSPPTEPADDDLRQLESLRDDGMISAEEFEAARAQLRSG